MHRRILLKLAAAALPLLAASGALAQSAQTYPNKPITLVAPFSAGGALDLIARLAPDRMAIVSEPTVEDTRDKLLLLRTIEGLAVELACAQASEADLDALAALHAELEQRVSRHDLSGYHLVNLQFHRRIVTAAHNKTLADFHQILTGHLEWARVRSQIRDELLPNAPEQHAQIMNCILRRDAANARKAMERHSAAVSYEILQRVEERERSSASPSLQPAA